MIYIFLVRGRMSTEERIDCDGSNSEVSDKVLESNFGLPSSPLTSNHDFATSLIGVSITAYSAQSCLHHPQFWRWARDEQESLLFRPVGRVSHP